MSKQQQTAITEGQGLHQQWYADAKQATLATLPAFMDHVLNDYRHDYGTICHALSACALAAAHAGDHSGQGGIAGFQSGAVMWGFVQNWLGEKGPMTFVRHENLLYPQYDHQYTTISKDTWTWVQDEARKNLKDNSGAHPDVVRHWASIDAGQVPFGLTVRD